ncbi:hypothetical protein F1559_001230 [Cyanidiococcus yangmingshanensis]|uniref:Haem-binding uptake Tiki superfamily ChaN domain-containing protein n=1 Tax=Cyanidiococcus yangmingshanensis TaxID=2690220 RepID=A0A7J7IER1_9RHOD|nr:hypothetical protein F1559_001230 [Cyanidiococcus yangmingshanensis]
MFAQGNVLNGLKAPEGFACGTSFVPGRLKRPPKRANLFRLRSSNREPHESGATSLSSVVNRLSRRTFLQLLGGSLLAINAPLPVSAALSKVAESSSVPHEHQTSPSWSTSFKAKSLDAIYRLTPNKSETSVLSVDEEACLDALAQNADLVLIGDHPRSQTDHAMEARIVAAMALRVAPSQDYSSEKSLLSVAIDAFEQHHQNLLDDYIHGRIQEEELYERSQWDERCVWPYERYLNLLRTCRSLGTRLIALNMQSVHRRALEKQGIQYLREDDAVRRLYFPDHERICDDLMLYTASPAYRLYASQVLEPHFASLQRHGFLGTDVSYTKFAEAALVQDAAMANLLRRQLESNKRRPANQARRCRLLACCELPHVAFGHGVRGLLEIRKYSEILHRAAGEGSDAFAGATQRVRARDEPIPMMNAQDTSSPEETALCVQTLLLNPTIADAGSRALTGKESRDWLLGKSPRRLRLELSRSMLEEIPPTQAAGHPSIRLFEAKPTLLHADSESNGAQGTDGPYLSTESTSPVGPLLLCDYLWISASKKGRIRV